MSTGRKTNNSQKSATHKQLCHEGGTNAKQISSDTRFTPSLNQGFLTGNQTLQDMASMEDMTNGKYLNEAFEGMSTDEKLSLILTELYKMKSNLNSLQHSSSAVKQQVDTHEAELRSADDATSNKIQQIEGKAQTNTADIESIHDINADLVERISVAENKINQNTMSVNWLKGTAERQNKQVASNHHKIIDLTARSMDHNFTISGLVEDKNENCKMIAMEFFRTQMLLQFQQDDILVAHRLGTRSQRQLKPRLMVVKVSHKLKDMIIPNTNRLKDKVNDQGHPFFVNQQIPEALAAERKVIQYEIKRIKDFNETVGPAGKKKQFTVSNKRLYIDEKLHEQLVLPPRPLEIFASVGDQQKMDDIEFNVSKPKTHNRSQFIGLATRVANLEQVQLAYRKVRQMYPSYDHVMMAYRISPNSIEGYQDDGEYAAGIKIHSKIVNMRCHGIAVFVVRNFGGIHIGPARFDCISAVAESAIEDLVHEFPEVRYPQPWQVNRLDADELINGRRNPIQNRLQDIADQQPQTDTPL